MFINTAKDYLQKRVEGKKLICYNYTVTIDSFPSSGKCMRCAETWTAKNAERVSAGERLFGSNRVSDIKVHAEMA